MATLPLSILAGMPTALNSPTIGPGPNSVGPFSTTMSAGAASPSLAARPWRVFSNSENNSNELRVSECTIQGWTAPSNRFSKPSSSSPACFQASLIRVFLDIVRVNCPLRVLRMSSMLLAGTPPMSTIPTTPSPERISASSETRSFFQCAALEDIILPPLP